MKRFLLALALLLTPSFALAQCNGVFANNTVCGNATGSTNTPRATNPSAFLGAAGGTNGQIQYNNAGALGGLTNTQVRTQLYPAIFQPENYGAVGDGVTDDTTAWVNLCNAVQSAGGGSIIAPANKNYLIYNSGQLINGSFVAMCNFTQINGVNIDMVGSKFTVGHIFPPNLPINVTGTAAGAGGACQITVSSTTGFYTGDLITTASIGGSTECNVTNAVGTVVDATHIRLAGTTFVNAWTSGGTLTTGNGNLLLLRLVSDTHVWVKDWSYVQSTPVSLPTAAPGSGVIGVALYSAVFPGGGSVGSSDITLININGTGGQNPIFMFGRATDTEAQDLHGITILGGSSTNEIYGVTASNGGSDVTVRDFRCVNVERCYFVYGVGNHDVSISSLNPISNDVLISTGGDATHSRPTHDIRLNYRILKRTSGTVGTSYVTFNLGGNGFANGTIANVDITLDYDASGEISIVPAIDIAKGTTSSLSSTIENIRIRGNIRGVPNLAGNLIDLFLAADAPWSGETAKNITLENLQIDGSATPAIRIETTPVISGGILLNNVIANQSLNITGAPPVLINSQFANVLPFMGTGLQLMGYAKAVNLNSVADTAIAISSPTTNWRLSQVAVFNTGTTASLTTAQFGLFSTTGGGGTALIASGTALSGITSNTINTNGTTGLFGTTGVWNYTTVQFRVTQAQGAAATGNVYIYGYPIP